MGKFLKHDLRANKKILKVFILIHLVLIGLAILGQAIFKGSLLKEAYFANLIFIGVLLYFMGLSIYFAYKSINRDFKSNSLYLLVTSPKNPRAYIWAKILTIGLVYILNFLGIFVILKVLKYEISSNIIYFILIGLIWMMIFASLIIFNRQIKRFNQASIYRFYYIGLILSILLFEYLFCKYLSLVIVGGKIQHAGPMDYGFIYPFAIGKFDQYKNLSTLIYYVLALVITVIINNWNLRKNKDLS